MRHIVRIIKKDYAVDMRQIYSISSILMFAITCSYLIFRTFGSDLSKQVWNILLWLIVLFVGINAIIKSFNQEHKSTYLYYYTLFGPHEILVARLLYNIFFLMVILSVIVLVFTILFENPIENYRLFLSGALGGVIGIASIFTFISIIAVGERGNTVMSILALPLVIPIVMLLVKVTSIAMGLMVDTTVYNDVMMIFGIDVLLIGVILLIFPSLWRA